MTSPYFGNCRFIVLSGQDPIIGGPPPVIDVYQKSMTNLSDIDNSTVTLRIRGWSDDIVVSGSTTKRPKTSSTQDFFVTLRGGEHFFVPSISTLKKWAE